MADDILQRDRRTPKRDFLALGAIAFVLCTVFLYYMRLAPVPLAPPLRLDKVPVPKPRETNIAAMATADMTTTKPGKGTWRKPYPKISTLPASLLPSTQDQDERRLIIIGDVHGHLKALEALLKKAEFSASRGDTVVFTGDMVNKGANSPGVVELAMKIGAFGVRGNHENRVLGAWEHERRRGKHRATSTEKEEAEEEEKAMERRTRNLTLDASGSAVDAQGQDENQGMQSNGTEEDGSGSQTNEHQNEETTEEEKEEEIKARKTHAADLATAKSLKPRHRAWLSALPLILRVGDLGPRYGEVVVVHAGLVPGVPLESQDPHAVMNIRTLLPPSDPRSADRKPQYLQKDADGQTQKQTDQSENQGKNRPRPMVPSPLRDGTPWARAWTSYQKDLTHYHHHARHTTVVYGHDSKAGLKMRKYAFGLDSGCGKGDTLTGVIFQVSARAADADGDNIEGEEEADWDAEEAGEDADGEGDRNNVNQGSQKKKKKEKNKGRRIRHRLVSVSCREVA
jgi:predicted phosphodiesterase